MHLSTLFMLQQAIYKTSKHKNNHSFIFRPFYMAVSIAAYILARSTLLFFINRFRSGYISSPNAPSITYMIKRCISNMTVYFSNKYISITNTTQMHFRSVALHKNKHNAKITYIDVLTFFSVFLLKVLSNWQNNQGSLSFVDLIIHMQSQKNSYIRILVINTYHIQYFLYYNHDQYQTFVTVWDVTIHNSLMIIQSINTWKMISFAYCCHFCDKVAILSLLLELNFGIFCIFGILARNVSKTE